MSNIVDWIFELMAMGIMIGTCWYVGCLAWEKFQEQRQSSRHKNSSKSKQMAKLNKEKLKELKQKQKQEKLSLAEASEYERLMRANKKWQTKLQGVAKVLGYIIAAICIYWIIDLFGIVWWNIRGGW